MTSADFCLTPQIIANFGCRFGLPHEPPPTDKQTSLGKNIDRPPIPLNLLHIFLCSCRALVCLATLPNIESLDIQFLFVETGFC